MYILKEIQYKVSACIYNSQGINESSIGEVQWHSICFNQEWGQV